MEATTWLSEDRLAIFLFHGVIDSSPYVIRNYTRKHLEKDYFVAVIRDLKKHGKPLSMEDVVRLKDVGGSFPPYAFAVTFDDGFENNYSLAAPILEDLKVPATFYVTTDFIENNTMSWIDRIEYAIEWHSPERLWLPWAREPVSIKGIGDKRNTLEDIRRRVKNDPAIDVDSLLNSIFEQCNSDPVYQSEDVLDKKMNWDQVRQLAHNENFIIGGHSHTHPTLSFLSQEMLENEVQTSIALLREKAAVHPRHYSYPEGLRNSYTEEVIRLLKRCGVVCCPTAIQGTNTISDNLFHLKRIMVF